MASRPPDPAQRLARLMKALATTTVDLDNLARTEGLAEELYELILTAPELRPVLARFGATRETLRRVYSELILAGAGQWEGGVFVAVAALTRPDTLAFVLERARPPGPDFERTWNHTSAALLEFFRTHDAAHLT